MFCKNCGNELNEEALFCGKCGANQSDFQNTSGSTAAKEKPDTAKIIVGIIILIILAAFVVNLMDWLLSAVGSSPSDKKKTRNTADYSYAEPAVRINDIEFDMSLCSITYEFENISDKDIAYITFETYFYDRVGGALTVGYDSKFSNLKYTGPLYAGSKDSAYWEYLFDMPDATAVVYPKKITVTFMDDEEITFENTIFCAANDFYGEKLKD